MSFDRYSLSKILAQKTLQPDVDIKKLSYQIAAYLLDNNLTDQLDSILRDMKLIRQENGLADVLVTSSHPIDQSLRKTIQDLVQKFYSSAREIIIETVIDPQLIGGVKIELASSVLDLSLASQLNRIMSSTKQKRI
jgi:F-type H+-transporting ATPase subunit O